MGKKIPIHQIKESQKGYLDDIQPLQEESKEPQVQTSVIIPKSLMRKIEEYFAKKRKEEDIYYTKKQVIIAALEEFFEKHQ